MAGDDINDHYDSDNDNPNYEYCPYSDQKILLVITVKHW